MENDEKNVEQTFSFGFFVGFFLSLIIFIILTPYLAWIQPARIESRLYNEKFGTHYTTNDFMFASGTIKAFLNQGEQKTQNINFNQALPIKIEK